MSLYICDPRMHKSCRRKKYKGICQTLCILTSCSEYSVDGRPLTEEEVEEKENEIRAKVEPDLKIGRNTGTQAQPAAAAEEEEPETEIDNCPEVKNESSRI